ncbi:hypothetical protein BU24DRAFT_366858 [Aaosphaeria arxii CBS 175.79]|uniref:Rad21/Rec8-like protein N-terminal domain-containing protein n=1 Tax=Aaosphaeria arxii CBS 175.79 TaxID=1450172 RepID=A0A6A5XWC3_9PLEO|nr:uncharacterized protein BU24DRAFT_366858 [Aaosphaeria arxii CBS 175.79]KAF2017223.1 hypothetical protein BU24DRAFT_366858 [Aaosphaeria arxii CBS 175.79]
MFYSHEVLTSREYGVAVVWLVATLGAKSNSKKINRNAILGVDVPKACQTIRDPAAPMALRLQGSLLYGVSRVYTQQCGYVLVDAERADHSMRSMVKVMKDAAIDLEAGKTRPEQLLLQDDPSFLPELILPPLDMLEDLGLDPPEKARRSGETQSLTPFGSQQNVAEGTPPVPLGRLIIPSSSSGGPGEFMLQGGDEPSSVGARIGLPGRGIDEPFPEPEFDIDEDGNLIEFSPRAGHSVTPFRMAESALPSDAPLSARVRVDFEEGQGNAAAVPGDPMDIDLPQFNDDLPGQDLELLNDDTPLEQPRETIASSTSSLAAPMHRKKRTRRVIPADKNMELRNKVLSDWNVSYLQNMKDAARAKHIQRASTQAKSNAEHYVWGVGIGRSGTQGSVTKTPFDSLYGDKLFELFTGINRKAFKGTKRDRDSGIDDYTQAESRHVRQKTEEEEIGRAAEDEGVLVHDEEVELPREAPSALDDQQMFSAMPWNISASIRGSSAVPRSGTGTGPRGSSRPLGGRMVSASPLQGRGQPGGLQALQAFSGEDDFGNIGPEDFGMGPSSDGLDPDPEPLVATQTSIRVREALSAEGGNFLNFVSDALAEKRIHRPAAVEQQACTMDEVLFEELLPPFENTKAIACQGLMMVLTLGTNGLLHVRQDLDLGEIGLSLTAKALAIQREMQNHDADDNEVGHSMENAEGGEEEGESAGDGYDSDDDYNSLYGD